VNLSIAKKLLFGGANFHATRIRVNNSVMKEKIALATCSEYPALTRDDQLLLPELAKSGFDASPVDWRSKAIQWESFHAVIVRNTWDYFEFLPEFLAWLDHLEKSEVRLFNPTSVIRENINKLYLRNLEANGVATPPTYWLYPKDLPDLESFLANFSSREFVLKPAISAGGFRTHRCQRKNLQENLSLAREILSGSTLMIQPFLQEFVADGELSFVFIGGEFSHSVIKRPKTGEFRVQWTHGGTHEAISVPLEIQKQAISVAEKLPQDLLYARIDGIVSKGKFLLVEAELVEPYLFLNECSGSPQRFANALIKALRN
jgi:glutathione synthase/RimK-type ligase-like ATP-grasp enzyme